MRQFSAAVYANENLILSEVLEKLENEFPLISIKVFGNSLANSTLTTATNEYDVLPAGMIDDEDILLVLSDPKDDMEALKEYEGDIVDFTGTFTAKDVYKIEEPIAYLVNAVQVNKEDMEAAAFLPAAVFGKSGVDDMINQTRELFAFTNTETKVFEERLAFNMFFSDMETGLLAGFRQKLKADTGLDIDIRMGAISTGFVLDLYFKKDVNKDFGYITESVGFVPTMADVCSRKRPVTVFRSKNRISIAGDYINVICAQITDSFKDIIGE
ncbi:hypothetical protein [Seleniivibrio woodruffii]|uniref:Uncharacterized protein n=1 Tax=Seleniivibrio woodruffii TaxID=1078050 RepID=A0A4R1KBZ1_9BACT|nr:hypothetical protein [Seleniivibrio woodruffii]TCK60639.1 hypothetical protein C8D98_1517 [Seleniivibrio woodruffii]TVZ36268.1 hypothetical protein OF66_1893 [Seleniivibrio woodruffii]